ncbi:MAG: arsenic efflux protein [Kiritimatiellae bacterium]|nr:arsenic efflux protein [Kiritimatiellia bacterium]
MPELTDIFLDSLHDAAAILAIVFCLHVFLSFFEGPLARILRRSRHFTPAAGALLGLVPECGISVVGADLFCKRHVTIGTLVAIFLSCSDEALPVMFGDFSGDWPMVFAMLACKVAIGTAVGMATDAVFGRRARAETPVSPAPGHPHGAETHRGCCGHDIEETSPWREHLLHPVVHSLKVFAYVLAVAFAFGVLLAWLGEDAVRGWLEANRLWSPLAAVAVGLVPNCASSAMLAELWLEQAIPFGSLLGGLLVNAGLGMFVLFRGSGRRREACAVLAICLATSLLSAYAAVLLF